MAPGSWRLATPPGLSCYSSERGSVHYVGNRGRGHPEQGGQLVRRHTSLRDLANNFRLLVGQFSKVRAPANLGRPVGALVGLVLSLRYPTQVAGTVVERVAIEVGALSIRRSLPVKSCRHYTVQRGRLSVRTPAKADAPIRPSHIGGHRLACVPANIPLIRSFVAVESGNAFPCCNHGSLLAQKTMNGKRVPRLDQRLQSPIAIFNEGRSVSWQV